LVLCAWLLLAGLARGSDGLRGPSYVAVVAAYPNELAALREATSEGFELEREITVNGITFTFGRAFGKPVVFFLTRISTVNAALTTQLALSRFPISMLLFSGVAGGINPALEKGDVAVPARWAYHAQGGYFNAREDGSLVLPSWRAPGSQEPFGMFLPSAVRVARDGQPEPVSKPWFMADADLLALAERVGAEAGLKNAHGKDAVIKVGGAGVAGPVFMDNADYREWVFKTWGADCLDMESTAVAHACWVNHKPFLIVRAMSDLAGGQHGENDFTEFARMAEANAARLLAAVLRAL
jgi:adenosylhomocysteine nucleosidase